MPQARVVYCFINSSAHALMLIVTWKQICESVSFVLQVHDFNAMVVVYLHVLWNIDMMQLAMCLIASIIVMALIRINQDAKLI